MQTATPNILQEPLEIVTKKTVAETLVDEIKAAGTEIVFGLPGGENVEVMDALRRSDIRFVLVRNESSAVYMADVYARLTGKPGVCLTTLGPGVLNAYVGIAHAYLDRAPVILISAETNQSLLPDYTHQAYPLTDILQPVTKMAQSLRSDNVSISVQKGLRLIRDQRPGPVHLSLSREMAQQMTDETHQPTVDSEYQSAELDNAIEALTGAARPVIVVGVGLESERPYEALQTLAEAANAPVIVTPKAKGALSDRHPLSAGTIGLSRVDPAYEILDEADCIIAVGFDVVELVKPWEQAAPLIWVAPWKNEDPVLPMVAEFAGPMQPSLEQLADLPYETDPSWGTERIATFHEKLAQQPLPAPQPGHILPQTVLESVRQHTPDDILITTDVGSHKIFTALTWPTYAPNRYMLSNGLSAMSFGVAGAIAGALTLNEHTLCVTGDAGLGMVMGELSLLAEYNLPVIIVVMNDSALDLIRSAQHRAGAPTFGTEFTNPDFGKIAEAYGLAFHRVADEDGCNHAIQAAMATQGPTLIEAVIDPVSYPTTVK